MNEVYPYKAKDRLNEAKTALDRIICAENIPELKGAVLSFVELSRFCTQVLLTEYKGKLAGFDDWWAEKAQYLKTDELCVFFRMQRNKAIKEGEEILDIHFMLNGGGSISNPYGPFPLQIGPDGFLFARPKGPAYEWVEADLPQYKITGWKFIGQPNQYTDTSGPDLCRQYYEKLDEIVDDFIAKFGGFKR